MKVIFAEKVRFRGQLFFRRNNGPLRVVFYLQRIISVGLGKSVIGNFFPLTVRRSGKTDLPRFLDPSIDKFGLRIPKVPSWRV